MSKTIDSTATKSVLIVDDEGGIRELLARALVQAGYRCDTAQEGGEALRKLRSTRFDAVLLDVIMPGKEGIETLLEVRRDWPDTKVIAMSGGGRIGPDDFLRLARTFGADDTLRKPITPSTVVESLRGLIGPGG